jgi:alpha-methylacyl-CoA racemase
MWRDEQDSTPTLMSAEKRGPLTGVRVIELAGMGPGPFAAMQLADMGCDVIRVERPGHVELGPATFNRGKRSIVLDIRSPNGVETLLELAARADILIEGFRPGVVERLGVGPEQCCARNPRLVYGRMTGWGQHGPRSQEAGHDIGYIALTGALHTIGPREGPPAPPLTLVGDFGGGAMFLLVGVLAALLEARTSGTGQVVDAAIVDGAAAMMGPVFELLSQGAWIDERESNLLDGGQPWYSTYRTSDGKWLAVGAIEEPFWLEFLDKLGIPANEGSRADSSRWPALRERVAAAIAARPRAYWEQVFEGTDACAVPVRSMNEATVDPHLVARETFVRVDGHLQAAPAPRFSRTPSTAPGGAACSTVQVGSVFADWGIDAEEVRV